jgi:2-C-methyl-D-erythritol 4-phosphate cytidylyltransferase
VTEKPLILECGSLMTDASFLSPPADAPRCHLLMPCAGSGSRAGTAQPKQYQLVAGQPLVRHTLAAFAAVERVDIRMVVVAPSDTAFDPAPPGVTRVACGGSSRAHSVFNGLEVLLAQGAERSDWVLVHDAARCLITPAQINRLIDACQDDPVGGLLALPLPDTLKAGEGGRAFQTVDRADKWLAQTPQMFRIGALQEAMAVHRARAFAGLTDEASAMELAGHRPLLVRSDAQNFKVTYPEDFSLAEAILRSRS